jgi:putative oxidoreductase
VSGKMLGQMSGASLPGEPALAWLVMLVELVGGALIVLGLLTRISSVLIAIVMIVALVTVKGFAFLTPDAQVWAGSIDWVILFTALTLAFIGPGAISLDKIFGIDD